MASVNGESRRDQRRLRFRVQVYPPDPQQSGYTSRYHTVRNTCCTVLERMPAEAAEAVLSAATVIWLGPAISRVRPLSCLGNKPLLVMLASDLDSYPPDVATAVVAHEFAHVCLGHRWRADADERENTAAEVAANDRAREWGFDRELDALDAYQSVEQSTESRHDKP